VNIGVLGSGRVGGTLGAAWAKRGHSVTFATRDPNSDKARALIQHAPNAHLAGLQGTVDASDLLVIALPWNVLPEVLSGLTRLEGKILLDATNRFGPATRSAGENLAALVPGANVVKAFNTIGFDHMDGPQFAEQPSMLVAGDDATAKRHVMQLTTELGFEAVDAGPLSNTGTLEALAKAWVGLSQVIGRDFAFRIVRKGG
jgi:hypothetical protein